MEWIKCIEDNYPDFEDNDYLIAIYQENQWYYFTNHDCPFGWNVLCRSEAYWMKIEKPKKNGEGI